MTPERVKASLYWLSLHSKARAVGQPGKADASRAARGRHRSGVASTNCPTSRTGRPKSSSEIYFTIVKENVMIIFVELVLLGSSPSRPSLNVDRKRRQKLE